MRRVRRFVRRANGPDRVWAGIAQQWVLSGITDSTAVALVQLQQPASLAALTSDPPEDLTILRIRGEFSVQATEGANSFVLGLTVQDTAWTPTAGTSGWNTDSDKRWLWSQTYSTGQATGAVGWSPPGQLESAGVTVCSAPREAVSLDIAPKVRVSSGQALYLVGYELTGTEALTVTGLTIRMLYQRSGRRSR